MVCFFAKDFFDGGGPDRVPASGICRQGTFEVHLRIIEPFIGQRGQRNATGDQSFAKGVGFDGRLEPVAAFRQGLEGTR